MLRFHKFHPASLNATDVEELSQLDRAINRTEAKGCRIRDSSDLSLSGNDAQVVPEEEVTFCEHCRVNGYNKGKYDETELSVQSRQKSGGALG